MDSNDSIALTGRKMDASTIASAHIPRQVAKRTKRMLASLFGQLLHSDPVVVLSDAFKDGDEGSRLGREMVDRALAITNLQMRSGCDVAAERIDEDDLTEDEASHLCAMLEERMSTLEHARFDPLFREFVATDWSAYFRASVGVQEIYRRMLQESRLELAPNELEKLRAQWKLMGQAIFLCSFFSQLKTFMEKYAAEDGGNREAWLNREPLRTLFG